MVFDVNMDLTHKARLVTYGHNNEDPQGSTYYGVVYIETIRIVITYKVLNVLNILAVDIYNVYLMMSTTEKHYIICDPRFYQRTLERRIFSRQPFIYLNHKIDI